MSIPTESIDGDMTADHDQEHLWPPLTNLGPSEELRLLRARIALLERQQMMNSTTSSCVSFDAQNANDAADTLCLQNDDIEPNNDKKAMADQQKEVEQTQADQLEILLMETNKKLEEEKQLNAELLAKIDELERKQKADQQKKHRAKIDERQQEGGRGGGGGGGFGCLNRDNEGGGLPSNNFSGGGGSGSDASGTRPNSILRIIIDTMPYPALDVLYRIFSRYGKVLRIITFNKGNSFQALIQLSEADSAQNAKNSLDGCNIYNGFCKLHIEYSKWSTLRVGQNNDKSRDYSNPIKFCGGGGFGRHNEGGGLPSNDFSGGGGSGNDGFSNSGWGGGEGRGGDRWNRWNDGRERGRGGGGGFGRPNRDNEGGGLPSNNFSGGGGSGNDGFSNSGWGGGEGRGGDRWNRWNDGRERGRGGGGFGRPNRDNEGGGLPSNNFSGGGGSGSDASGTRPNSILRIIIDTMPYPALDVLYRIFSRYGKVLRIITFNKGNSFQALIQLSEADSAQNAKNSLDGCNIYNGFCKLHIEYSKWSTLRVGRNNDKSRDYSNPIKFCGGGGFGRHNEGGGLPSNDFSGGGGSGNDGFSNSGWGGGEGRGGDRWNRWNDGRERGRGGGGFGRPNRDNEGGGLPSNDFSGGGGFGSSGQHNQQQQQQSNQQQQHNHHAHRQLHNSESARSCTSSLAGSVYDDLAAPDQHHHQQHTSSSQTRLCHRLGPSSSSFASCSITGHNNRSDSVGSTHSAAAFSLPGSSLMSQKLTSHRVQQQSAADDGPHNSPEIIFVDDVIRNKCVPPIGHNTVKTELGEAELIGIEEDVPSGEPPVVLNSPRAKKVKKEEPN